MNDDRLQDPGETLDHPIDWSDWLATGETITASTWASSPAEGATGETITLDDDDFDDTSATVTLSGVMFGHVYRLTNTITTNVSPARTGVRSLTVRGFKE